MHLLFVYGTLKRSKIQKEAIGRKIKGIPDVLTDYKKTKVYKKNESFPLIVKTPKSYVKGLILPISKKELNVLDDYEDTMYTRRKIKLKSGKSAWVYKK